MKKIFKTNLKDILFLATLFIILILCVCITLEIFLRIKKMHPKYVFNKSIGPMINLTPSLWYNRTNYSYIFKCKDALSDSIYHDSLGHRIEFNVAKLNNKNEEKKIKILAIGDSFTYGWGARNGKSYIANLYKAFNTKNNDKFEIVNAACPSYCIETEYAYLKMFFDDFNPDIVLLNILSNDLRDMYKGRERLKILNGHQMTKEGASIACSNNFLLKEIFLIQWIYLKYKRIKYIASVYKLFREISIEREKLFIKAMNVINNTNELCKKNNTKFILVYIPERDGGIMDKKFSEFLSRECKHPFINTYQTISKMENWKSLYYKKDKHFREKGYKVLSEVVFSQLFPICQNLKSDNK